MMTRTLLRVVAIAIAIAALVDPQITWSVPQRQPVTIVTMHADDVTYAERLQRRLSADYDPTIHVADPTSIAAACPASGGCVLVSRGEVPRRLSAGAVVLGALRVRASSERVIRGVDAPVRVHRDAASSVRVTLSRPVARVDLLDGGVVVGSAEPGDSLAVDVPWVPLGEGARALRVLAGDEVEDVGVVVEADPVAVFVYEPEPTWMGTFVRRAIDDDPRFTGGGRTRIAPAVTVTRGGGGPLSAAALGDAGAVVITAPQTLSAADAALLERFVTERGGSLIVVPDQRPSGAMLRLIPRVSGLHRDPQPREVGLLRVREWLTFDPAAGITTIAALAGNPVVMSRVVGHGRVIVSGALDAWRFRDATSSFNTFWTGLVWEAAMAGGKPLHMQAEHVLARPGEPVRVEAELQSMDPLPTQLSASGSMICGGQREAIRWWPGARPGTFDTVVRLSGSNACELSLVVNGRTATLPFAVRRQVQRGEVHEDAIEAAIQAHGGLVAEINDGETALLSRARAELPTVENRSASWPMRSPYWLMVLGACLSSEWWLRRRAGLS